MDDNRPFAGLAVWTVRIAALAIALALLWWSGHLEREFQVGYTADLRYDWGLYWLIHAVYVVAGMAFAVAVRFPFPRSRYAWGRILIAGIVILPAAHLWLMFHLMSVPQFLQRAYWFDNVPRAVWPILSGVAIGAGFGARLPALSDEESPIA